MAETQGASANAVATKKIRVDIGRPKMTVLQILTIAALAGLFGGCAQKSEVDKCVEAWDATVDFIPDDAVAKTNQRFAVRKECMRPGYTANKNLAMDLETIQTLCAKRAGSDKPVKDGSGAITYTLPGSTDRVKADCELEYRIKQQEANKPF